MMEQASRSGPAFAGFASDQLMKNKNRNSRGLSDVSVLASCSILTKFERPKKASNINQR